MIFVFSLFLSVFIAIISRVYLINSMLPKHSLDLNMILSFLLLKILTSFLFFFLFTLNLNLQISSHLLLPSPKTRTQTTWDTTLVGSNLTRSTKLNPEIGLRCSHMLSQSNMAWKKGWLRVGELLQLQKQLLGLTRVVNRWKKIQVCILSMSSKPMQTW